MTTNLNRLISFAGLFLILSSCASILNPRYQKITIDKPEGSKVLIDGHSPEIKKDKFLVNRDAEAKQITILKEGYKDENLTIIQNHKSPLYIMSIVPFTALIIPPFYDNLEKSRNYVSSVSLPRGLTPLPDKNKFNNIIYFSPLEFNLPGDSLKTTDFILYNNYIKGNPESGKEITGDADEMRKLKLLNPNILLTASLEQKNYSTDNSKEIEITANISSIEKQYINSYRDQSWTTYPSFGKMLVIQLGIEWSVKNGEKILNYYTNTKSGEFAFGYGDSSVVEASKNALTDAAEYGIIELLNSSELQKIIENSANEQAIPDDELASENQIKDSLLNLISIEKNGDNTYLVKNGKRLKIDRELGIGNFHKDNVLEFIKDQPELYAFAKENFHKGPGFISSLVSCYNNFELNPPKNIDQSYYYQFGLITKREWKKGPSDEMLKEKKYITGQLFHLITTTQHYVNSMPTTSTTGDNFKFTFFYGNAEYKSGFMMKNLKTAFQDDKEAIKYIRKYRGKKIRRYCFGAVGVGIVGVAVYMAGYLKGNEEIFGLDEDSTPFVAIPGVLITGGVLSLDRSYKTELISKGIDTYNLNLSKIPK